MGDDGGPATEGTELRVHGVAAVGAEAMLDRPIVSRIAGDRNAGFYRPQPGHGDARGPGGLLVEAYRWSSLTAGTATRTLSLVVLLPFMLSNLAIWTRPPGTRRVGPVKALCRVLAATITAMYVLSVIGVSLDLVAWQCVPYDRCIEDRRYIGWLRLLGPGPRLAVLSLLPLAAVGVVWWLGSRFWRSYEVFRVGAVGPAGDRLDAIGQWDGMPLVGRLRSIHVAIGLGTVAASLLTVAVLEEVTAAEVLLAATVAILFVCVVLLCTPFLGDLTGRGKLAERICVVVRNVACGLIVVTLAVLALQSGDWAEAGGLPGYGHMVNWLFATQAVLLVALIALTWQRQRPNGSRALLRGLGAPLLSSAAIGFAVAFSSGLIYRVADHLDRDGTPNPIQDIPPGDPPLQPPLAYRWAVAGFFLAIIAAIVVGVSWHHATRARERRIAGTITAKDFAGAPDSARPRLDELRNAIATAKVTERLGPLLVAYAVVAALGVISTVFGLADVAPSDVAGWVGGYRAKASLAYFADIGTYVVALFVLGLLFAGVFAYRSSGMRRVVGVLWDIGTFWPRAAHPFAPPCYAERAVPELSKRIHYLTREERNVVVVSGHSHGSVLAAATILQLPPESLKRVALLTYGSPLHRIYSRLFPAYVGEEVLWEIGDRVGWRWINLWRDTDPIGGWVLSPHRLGEQPVIDGPAGTVDWRLRDPAGVTVPPNDTVPPPIQGHWPYYTDEHFAAAVVDLVRQLTPAMQGERLSVGPSGHGQLAETGRPPSGGDGGRRGFDSGGDEPNPAQRPRGVQPPSAR
jgi:hypothetical protein